MSDAGTSGPLDAREGAVGVSVADPGARDGGRRALRRSPRRARGGDGAASSGGAVIYLGVDTLTYHLRLERGEVSVDDVLEQAEELGCRCVQVTLHHVRRLGIRELDLLRQRAAARGLSLLASGGTLGRRRRGDRPGDAVAVVEDWLTRARALGSPTLRVVSGFYRADIAGQPAEIERERRFVVDALHACAPIAADFGVTLLLENHSDFRAAEFRSIMEDVRGDKVGVFLDLINPISGFEDAEAVVTLLAPYAHAGHVKDYTLRSVPTDDGYHRRGFDVRWVYPGEGVAYLGGLVRALREGVGDRDYWLTIEGLDNYVNRDDQRARLRASVGLLEPMLR